MEKRKESLRAAKLCRFCLSQDQSLDSLYDRNRALKNAINLHLKILSCVSIEVLPSDKMPTYICNRCKNFMNLFYDFKQIVRRADESIFQYLQNGTPMETIEWPAALNKISPSSNEINVVKTVVEGGTTIQVSSQVISDSDEEEANVYNIKIGDGLDDTNTACIKVVTSKDQDKEDSTQSGKGFVSLSKLTKHVRSHAGDRPYPCKYCDKSFLKSHHYTRHLRLKHRSSRPSEQYRCEQCEDVFSSQDDLIYHSAIHATQNLICPLCQEKFQNVDDVTTHIKSHVNGVEFMCDFCELVFTTKEKLDNHLITMHEDEVQHEELEELDELEESSIEEIEDDNGINLKEEGDHMVIEINKGDYMINKTNETEVKSLINSEDSELENTYTELATVDTITVLKKNEAVKSIEEKSESKSVEPVIKKIDNIEIVQQPVPVVRRNEEIKRKAEQAPQEAVVEKKEKKSETNSGGANDKSLRLLEKELQDLKRTNSKSEIQKSSPKNLDMLRNKRLPIQTSTPKSYTSRATEEKKLALANKTLTQEKKPEKRQITKENKEPKDVKETKSNNGNNKEEKETAKGVIKNGSNNDKSTSEDGVRRSTRPSKIKDYAKMVRDKSQPSSDMDESSDEDEEYRESDRSSESRSKIRRINPIKSKSGDATPAATVPRKRGRPRKETKSSKEIPAKIRKDDIDTAEEDKMEDTSALEKSSSKEDKRNTDTEDSETNQTTPKTPEQKSFSSDLLVSPSGQTLKKVPIKALPPGIKPLPLPVNARPVASGELCEMQIGKKVVKVQKIVMTKAEVEAMAKKGLVEMKDGTMVLKQGIKLPTMESVGAKPSNLGEGDTGKESLMNKKEKAVPTRCDLGDDS